MVTGKAEAGLSAVSGKGSYARSSSKTFDKEQFDETVKLHPEEVFPMIKLPEEDVCEMKTGGIQRTVANENKLIFYSLHKHKAVPDTV